MSQPVFDLVKSLTKQEKIFFKRYSEISGKKEPNYIKLFNALDSLPEYDEKKLRKKLKNPPWMKRLAYERLYLKNALLDSLYVRNASIAENKEDESNARRQLEKQIEIINTLIKKRLFHIATPLTQKAKAEAKKHEWFTEQAKLATLDYILAKFISDKKSTYAERQQAALKEEIEALQKAVNWREYILFHSQVGSNKLPAKDIRHHYEAFLNNPLLKKENAHSVRAEHVRLSLLTQIYHQLEETEKSEKLIRENVALMEQNPWSTTSDVRLVMMANHVLACNMLLLKNAGNNTLQKLTDFKTQNDNTNLFREAYWMAAGVPFWMDTGQLHQMETNKDKIVRILKRDTERVLPGVSKLKAYIYMMAYEMLNENIEAALDWFDVLSNYIAYNLEAKLQGDARILQVIAHFELGNHYLVESLCKSIVRKVKSAAPEFERQKMLLSGINKAATSLIPHGHWQHLYECLHAAPHGGDVLYKHTFQIFLSWVKSKATGKNWKTVFEE